MSDLGERESSDEDDKFPSPERKVFLPPLQRCSHLNPVREESERDFIPIISVQQNTVASSTIPSVAASIIHIAARTLPVPPFGNLSDFGFNAIKAESLFDVSSSEEEEDEKKEDEP